MSLEPLFALINPASSSSRILSTKIELVLKKTQPGTKWSALESSEKPSSAGVADPAASVTKPSQAESAPAYPTSSRSGPKNWDQIAQSYTKPASKGPSKKPKRKDRSKESEGAEEQAGSSSSSENEETRGNENDEFIDEYEDGDPVNGFFKKLYAGASDETRRAMMKSYQESGGTALSTNWDEVKKEKVKVTPPDGMVEKKWGE